MKRGSLLRREPLGAALVAVNLALAAALVYRKTASARGGLPPGHPDVSVPAGLAAAPKDEEFALSGVVELAPALRGRWPKGAYVFVIARGEGGGPPFAARRYAAATPPFAWSLGADDRMLGGAAPPRVVVTARVDQDGDALTRQLGDLESAPSAPVPPRASVELVIDREAPLAP